MLWCDVTSAQVVCVVPGDTDLVVNRFGSSRMAAVTKQEALAEALTPPSDMTSYHASADRGPGVVPGGNPWNALPPDGSIVVGDIGAVVSQFGHAC